MNFHEIPGQSCPFDIPANWSGREGVRDFMFSGWHGVSGPLECIENDRRTFLPGGISGSKDSAWIGRVGIRKVLAAGVFPAGVIGVHPPGYGGFCRPDESVAFQNLATVPFNDRVLSAVGDHQGRG